MEVSGGEVPEPINEFTRDNMPDSLFQNIIRCQYKRPTPVQKYGMAIGMANRDLMACAQTGAFVSPVSHAGSGKTAGFLFPIIATVRPRRRCPKCRARTSSTPRR